MKKSKKKLPLKAKITKTEIEDFPHPDYMTKMEEEGAKAIAKMVNDCIMKELTNPFSTLNDPDGSKKKRKNNIESREKKIKRVFGIE